MTEEDTMRNFLLLFSRYWGDPEAHTGLSNLRDEVAKQGQWRALIDAHLKAIEGENDEAIALLETILDAKPHNICACLLLGRILSSEIDEAPYAIEIYDNLLQKGFHDQAHSDWLEALTLGNKSLALSVLRKDVREVARTILGRFEKSKDVLILGQVGRVLSNHGGTLGLQKDGAEEAIDVLDCVVRRFGEYTDPDLHVIVALTLYNKGIILQRMENKAREAIEVSDEVVRRFGESTELGLRVSVALALCNKGIILQRVENKADEAIEALDQVDRLFGECTELGLRLIVARALVSKSQALKNMDRLDEAIAACDVVVARFGESLQLALRDEVAHALLQRADCLLDRGATEKARARVLVSNVGDCYVNRPVQSLVAYHYAFLLGRLSSRGEGDPVRDREILDHHDNAYQFGYLSVVRKLVGKRKLDNYFEKMEQAKKKRDQFINASSPGFGPKESSLLVLREWNSYTPLIPGREEADRGGGYFIRHASEGIVIDPGYNFIENFHRAGGNLCDIDHVILTHAHDDHTAQLEALLTLFYQRRKNGKTKEVHFYMSEGVSRKFAGLPPLWDNGIDRYQLKRPKGDYLQTLQLNSKTQLTVLPAYHEDAATTDTAVGLAFEFTCENGALRKMVFTSDSGLYPPKPDEQGKKTALWQAYPKNVQDPDLLVAHIGSIIKSEFESFSHRAEAPQYYPNHLGMMGTFTMLHHMNPKASVISEFGSELKDIRVDLVETLRQALDNGQGVDAGDTATNQRPTFVVPGDLNIAYDIETGRFLCHSDCEYREHHELCCREATDYEPEWREDTQRYSPIPKTRATRAYLFRKNLKDSTPHEDNRSAQQYWDKLWNRDLPYHNREASDAASNEP